MQHMNNLQMQPETGTNPDDNGEYYNYGMTDAEMIDFNTKYPGNPCSPRHSWYAGEGYGAVCRA